MAKHTVPSPKGKRPKRLFTPPPGSAGGGKGYDKRRGHPKLITITLAMRHSFNGRFYGPGPVRVTREKAERLLNTEYEAAQKEVNLQQQQAFLLVNRGGVIGKRQVPFAQFDQILANSEVQFP